MKIGQYYQRQRCRHVELEQFWQAFALHGFVSDSWAFLYNHFYRAMLRRVRYCYGILIFTIYHSLGLLLQTENWPPSKILCSIYSHSDSFWTAFTDLGLGPDLWAMTFVCFNFFILYIFLYLVCYLSRPHSAFQSTINSRRVLYRIVSYKMTSILLPTGSITWMLCMHARRSLPVLISFDWGYWSPIN